MASERVARRAVACDVGALKRPDVSSIDGLARLQLAARRFGCTIELSGACDELVDLIELVGLGDVLPPTRR